MPDIDASLRPGIVKQWGQWVKSKPIEIDGKPTRWRINGIYDLIAHNDDGTVGLIDCKVSDSERDSGEFYAPQLEAYAFAIENPASGKEFSVASMGLLIWKLNGTTQTSEGGHGFGVIQNYVPVARNRAKFQEVIADFIDCLEGSLPDAGPECPTCNYLTQRLALEK
ncbi:unannotated protein [freshwater metagenome]